jgi:hypothetical protein
MSDDMQCTELDILRVLKMGHMDFTATVVDDTDKCQFSLQAQQVIREELGFDYVPNKNTTCMET